MTTKEALLKIRELIQNGWTKGVEARDNCGDSVGVYDNEAVCYCLVGAISRVVYEESRTVLTWDNNRYNLLLSVTKLLNSFISDNNNPARDIVYDLVIFNDKPSTTKKDVLDLIDAAINQINW